MGKNLIAGLAFVCILAAAGASEADQAIINAKAPEFSLSDQYGRTFDLKRAEGRTILIVASDGEGSKHNREWVDAIKGRYQGRIEIIGIADTRRVPFLLKGYVKRKFKKSPDPILLDWHGVVFTSYGLAPNLSNIVLIDKDGIIRYRTAGDALPDACNKLFREIDKLERRRSYEQ